MKKPAAASLRLLPAVLLCLILALLCACGNLAVPVQTPLPEAEGLRIAVASDLHFDPEHTDKNANLGAVAYNPQLAEALLWDAQHQGAEVLLLTGDIVNAGKQEYHDGLIEKLRAAEDAGLRIYVLPGNHDLSPVTQREFAALYADFGFAEADSRDAASLSYCVMGEDLCLLMLDTAGYDAEAIDLPEAQSRSDDEAFLSEETLRWTREMLESAKAQQLPVLCAGHFNILTAEGRDPERTGLYLENGERLAALLREYDVPLYVSGHLHTRLVLQEQGLTELVTEYLLAYPTGYSMLDLTADAITYTPRRVDVEGWAREVGYNSRELKHFSRWQQKQLRDYAFQNVSDMSKRNPLTRKEAAQAVDFFYAAMNAYWAGTLYAQREALEAMPGYEPFFRCAEGYAYEWWLRDLIENATPMLGGFRLERP